MLYGYRFDIHTFRFQKYGVIHLLGDLQNVNLYLQGEKRNISLPYVISDSPLGDQTLQIQKEGYLPFNKTALVSDARVFDVKVQLVPSLELWKNKLQLKLTDDDIISENGLAHLDYANKTLDIYSGAHDVLAKKVSIRLTLPEEISKENFTALTYLDKNYFLLQLGDTYYVLSSDRIVPIKKEPFEKLFVFDHGLFMFNKNIGTLSTLSFITLEKKVIDTALMETNYIEHTILENANLQSQVFVKNNHYYYIETSSGANKLTEIQIFEESPHEIYILDKNIYYKDSHGILRRKGTGDLLLSGIVSSFPVPGQMLFVTNSQKIYRLTGDRVEYVGNVVGKQIWNVNLPITGEYYLLQHYNGLIAYDSDNDIKYELYPTKTPLDIKVQIIGPYLDIKDYAKNTRSVYVLDQK